MAISLLQTYWPSRTNTVVLISIYSKDCYEFILSFYSSLFNNFITSITVSQPYTKFSTPIPIFFPHNKYRFLNFSSHLKCIIIRSVSRLKWLHNWLSPYISPIFKPFPRSTLLSLHGTVIRQLTPSGTQIHVVIFRKSP